MWRAVPARRAQVASWCFAAARVNRFHMTKSCLYDWLLLLHRLVKLLVLTVIESLVRVYQHKPDIGLESRRDCARP